jgi:hypothetical protein
VIDLDQLVTLVMMGLCLILLGLWPGLLKSCADGIDDVTNLLLVRLGARSRQRSGPLEPHWFALAGVAVIALTFLAYLSN